MDIQPVKGLPLIDTVQGGQRVRRAVVLCGACSRYGVEGWSHICGKSWHASIQALRLYLLR